MEAQAAQNGIHPVNPRKRRRRRRLDRPAISARLLLDERLKGEVGVLSEDLFVDLFGRGAGTYGCSWAVLYQN
jgi:peroxin-6